MSEMAQRELPEGWKWQTFGDVAELLRGITYTKDVVSDEPAGGNAPILRANNIGGGLNFDGLVYVPIELIKKEQYIKKNDIIIAMSSGSKRLVGKAAQATTDFLGSYGAFCASLRVAENLIPQYIFYYYSSQENLRRISAASSGSNINNLKREHILKSPVPIAPLDQQKRIVAKIEELFSHIDAGVEGLKKTQRLLKQYRQSVLKAAVTGELTKEWREENKDKVEPASALLKRILKEKQKKAKGKYKEPEPLEEVPDTILPDTWQWVAIGQVFDVYVGATPSRKEPKYWDGDINWVSSGEVAFCRIKKTKEAITGDGLKNTSTELHPPGTVMLGMIGEGKTREQAAILDIHAAHNQNTAAIVKCVDEMSSEYLYFYLMQQYEITRRRGSGNNQKALNKTRVQAIEFPLSSVQEQKEIVALAQEKLDSIERLESEIIIFMKKAERNKQSFLSWSFQGKT